MGTMLVPRTRTVKCCGNGRDIHQRSRLSALRCLAYFTSGSSASSTSVTPSLISFSGFASDSVRSPCFFLEFFLRSIFALT